MKKAYKHHYSLGRRLIGL